MVGGGSGGVQSHFLVQPNYSVEVVLCCRWGCDKTSWIEISFSQTSTNHRVGLQTLRVVLGIGLSRSVNTTHLYTFSVFRSQIPNRRNEGNISFPSRERNEEEVHSFCQ